MTEAEWLACEDADWMLFALEGLSTARKLRLFGCAASRRMWGVLPDDRCRATIELAEQFADEDVPVTAMMLAHEESEEAYKETLIAQEGTYTVALELMYVASALANPAVHVNYYRCVAKALAGVSRCGTARERRAQAVLLRDIFGNPFRPVTFSPEWRTSTAVALARQMYESRDLAAMPILADALQDAGCDSADILTHCRGPGPHVRGCWVVDLVLGKE